MKFKNYIAAVLAVLMLALMLMPCRDNCNSFSHDKPTTIQAAQDHHQTHNDICSPFCFCTCCATAMNIHNFPTFGFIPHLSVQDFSMLEQVFLSKEQSAIWQPPKIS